MIRRILSLILTLGVLTFLIFYIKNHWVDFNIIRSISWSNAAFLLGLSFIYIFIQGLILKTLVEPFKVILRWHEWLGLTFITLLGNYFIPFGGFGFRAVYLKRKHQFSYSQFIGSLIATTLIEFMIFGLAGLVSLFYLWIYRHTFAWVLMLFLFGIMAATLFLMFYPWPKLKKKSKFIQFFNNVNQSWQVFHRNPRLMQKIIQLNFWLMVVSASIFFFSFRSFHLDINWLESLLPASLSDFSLFVRLMPASFGFYEGAVVVATKTLGLTIPIGLTITALIRIAQLFWLFTLGPLFSLILARQR